jgi:hypothetical protein
VVRRREARVEDISKDPSNFCCRKRSVGGGPEGRRRGDGAGETEGAAEGAEGRMEGAPM